MMNFEVWKKTKEKDLYWKRKVCTWTPIQRAEICKHAAERGNASSVRAMDLKYPRLKRQTISDFKLAYLKLKKK